MIYIKQGIHYILSAVPILAIFYIEYFFIGHDGYPHDFIYFTLGTILLFTSYQWISKSSLWTYNTIIPWLLALLCSFTSPVLEWLTTYHPVRFKYLVINASFSLSLLLFFLSIFTLFRSNASNIKIKAATLASLTILSCVIPFCEITYFSKFRHIISIDSLTALYQTNPYEAYGFITGLFSPIEIIIYSAMLFVSFSLSYYYYYTTLKRSISVTFPKVPMILFMIFSLLLTGTLLRHTYVIKNLREIAQYEQQLLEYTNLHNEIFNNLTLHGNNASILKAPGTIILVIGESANRRYMSAFNLDAPYPTTPWQSKMRQDKTDFFFFDNAYSSYVQTVKCLERALTERNQYQDTDFLTATNIIDIARKAGYKTYWFSNQGTFGGADTSNSLIAKTADNTIWTERIFSGSSSKDEALLPLLSSVNPNENNFIVLHIMGSHLDYRATYPQSFDQFHKGDGSQDTVEYYSNSLSYTDHFLQQVFQYAQKHLHLQAMIYFSDHADELGVGHNPDAASVEMTRIPFWIYLSPAYQKAYPQEVDTLRSREKAPWTNDLFYDLFIGLLHAYPPHYDPGKDFSNPAYRYNKDNLTTLLGKYPLSQDPLLHP